MEVILFIALLVFSVIILLQHSKLNKIEKKINRIFKEVSRLSESQKDKSTFTTSPQNFDLKSVEDFVFEDDWESQYLPNLTDQQQKNNNELSAETVLTTNETTPAEPLNHAVSSKSQKHTDIEKYIGENLVNLIGIAVLVLGIGYFVKYAIDKNWIGEAGRAFIGMVAGGLLIGLAHRMRSTYRTFSSILVGGGLSVFYFTTSIAFHEYALFSQTVAFFIMVSITSFAVLLSLRYDRMELAALAIVGGFVSPFMVSKGDGSYVTLFTYIIILNSGMLVLAYFKNWRLLNIICFVLTVLVFGGWFLGYIIIPDYREFSGLRYLFNKLSLSEISSEKIILYKNTFLFSTLFYIVFLAMIMMNLFRWGSTKDKSRSVILVINHFLYFFSGIYFMHFISAINLKGILLMGIFLVNGLTWIRFRAQSTIGNLHENNLFLYIALVALYLAVPYQFKHQHITLGWMLISAMLFWYGTKKQEISIEIASVATLMSGLMSLVINWIIVYAKNENLPLLFNGIFITGLISVLCLLFIKSKIKYFREGFLYKTDLNFFSSLLSILIILVLYFNGYYELSYQLNKWDLSEKAVQIYLSVYLYFYMLMVMLYYEKRSTEASRFLLLTASSICVLLFVFYAYNVVSYRNAYLKGTETHIHPFLSHYISTILLLVIMYKCFRMVQKYFLDSSIIHNIFFWYTSLIFVLLVSIEAEHVVVWFFHSDGTSVSSVTGKYYKVGLPILWGMCALLFMVWGMSMKIKTLRIIALSLFALTLVKLFLFDIRNIPQAGKIAAFVSLGIFLLIISFMYQKVKKLLANDTEPNKVKQ
ncbi:MAG: DUF2339 domain-containing protein [Cytophagaceae bacterium]|nr:DUF2339 domain-containing protein [Cytophagaceae bacterium]MDW8455796.1 DUF2339 domain-containing protein [Cytophagaceae bacterium]